MKTKAFIVSCSCFLMAGCIWEPYPAYSVQKVSIEEVPDHILASYLRKYSDVRLLEIERSVFESRIQGYPKCWRFQFEGKTKEIRTAVFDAKGDEVDFEHWFPEKD